MVVWGHSQCDGVILMDRGYDELYNLDNYGNQQRGPNGASPVQGQQRYQRYNQQYQQGYDPRYNQGYSQQGYDPRYNQQYQRQGSTGGYNPQQAAYQRQQQIHRQQGYRSAQRNNMPVDDDYDEPTGLFGKIGNAISRRKQDAMAKKRVIKCNYAEYDKVAFDESAFIKILN